MRNKKVIIRAFTVSQSLDFLKEILPVMMERYTVKVLCSPEKSIDEIQRECPVEVIPVNMYRRFSPMKDIVSLWKLIRVFRRERPDMVHSMTPKAGLLCMLAAWITGVPVRVHTFTGLVFPTASGFSRMVLIMTDRITCFCATHIIPEGEGVKNDLLSNHITRKPLKVLGYGNIRGVNMDYYSRRKEVMRKSVELELRDDTKFTFLFVGRIVRDKGINELVAAFVRLHQEDPKTRLWLVGGFEDCLNPVDNQTRQHINENDSIWAVGEKYGEELLAYYASVDCFILPSYREGFPNTVLEAGAMGLPSIVTDINGSREIIREGVNGLIVPPHDVEALYAAMKKAVAEPSNLAIMASNARDMILTRFEQSYVIQCQLDFYQSVF